MFIYLLLFCFINTSKLLSTNKSILQRGVPLYLESHYTIEFTGNHSEIQLLDMLKANNFKINVDKGENF